MKINHIISPAYSFKGIKVSKKQKPIDIRTVKPQQQIFDDWYRELVLLDDLMNSKVIKKSSEINSEIEQKYLVGPGLFTDSKSKYSEKKSAYESQKCSLDEKLKYADQMVQISDNATNALDNFFFCTDEKKIKSHHSKNNGISRVAGYKPELSVIQKEFIDRIKAEKSGQDIDIFGSILFFGPYSNGKTYITESVAQETNCIISSIFTKKGKEKEIMNQIIEEAEKSEERFKKDRTRTIIFIDEADKIIGRNSSIAKEFENFIKTCSQKYHCSVFATTNEPLNLSLDMNNVDVFPIKMSIDPPINSNIEDIFKFALSPYETEKNINFKDISKAVRQKEKEMKGKFSNGQIVSMCDNIAMKLQDKPISQNDIIEFIKLAEPEISENLCQKFDNDYYTLIGG